MTAGLNGLCVSSSSLQNAVLCCSLPGRIAPRPGAAQRRAVSPPATIVASSVTELLSPPCDVTMVAAAWIAGPGFVDSPRPLPYIPASAQPRHSPLEPAP